MSAPPTASDKARVVAIVVDGYSFALNTRREGGDFNPFAFAQLVDFVSHEIGVKANATVRVPAQGRHIFYPDPTDAQKKNLTSNEQCLETHKFLHTLREKGWQDHLTNFKKESGTWKASTEDLALGQLCTTLTQPEYFEPIGADPTRVTLTDLVIVTSDKDHLVTLNAGASDKVLRWCARPSSQPISRELQDWGEGRERMLVFPVPSKANKGNPRQQPQQNQQSQPQPSRKEVCTFYNKPGGCTRGSSCPYLHPVKESTELCKHYATVRGCKEGANCRFVHSSTLAGANLAKKSAELCRFQASPEGCREGAQCRFTHVDDARPLPKNAAAAAAAAVGLHPCVAQFGECRFGEYCRFAKVPADLCVTFLRTRQCKHGTACRWEHKLLTAASNASTQNQQNGSPVGSRASEDGPETEEMQKLKAQVAEAKARAKLAEEQRELEGMYRVCSEFARGKGKPNPMRNPVAASGPVAQLFVAGLVRLGYTGGIRELLDTPANYTVGFHGTSSVEAICGIFETGFDPSRRRGQMYGPGEYFDVGTGSVAASYEGNTRCSIVTLIVTKQKDGTPLKEVTSHQHGGQQPIMVVDNPIGSPPPYAYCIPCAVASDTQLRQQVEKAVKDQFPDEYEAMKAGNPLGSTTTATTTPAQSNGTLHVYCDLPGQNSSTWQPYGAAEQAQVDAFVAQGKQTFQLTMTARNYVYTVDLVNMTQTNNFSKKVRQLKWVSQSAVTGHTLSSQPQPPAFAQLRSMGIDDATAKWALQNTNNDPQRAVDWVFSHPEGPPPSL